MNLLKEGDDAFVEKHRHVETPMGTVLKMSFS